MISRREARNAALGIGLTSNAHANELAPANFKSASPGSTPGGHPQNGPAMASADTRPRVVAGAVGAVSRTLEQFNQDMQAAKDLVASGGKVVELDTLRSKIRFSRTDLKHIRKFRRASSNQLDKVGSRSQFSCGRLARHLPAIRSHTVIDVSPPAVIWAEKSLRS